MTVVPHRVAALQPLGRNPGFALAVIVTLALGIAPNCMVFAIMDAIYFRLLPYPAQARLVLLNVSHADRTALAGADSFSLAEWRLRSSSFRQLAAYRNAGFNLTFEARPERIPGQLVSGEFFGALGMAPVLGRAIGEADCAPGAPAVLVISHRTWHQLFNGRGDIVNLAVRLNGLPATIVGVMPAEFVSFMEGRGARTWAPLTLDRRTGPGGAAANVIGRLRPGITLERAQAELTTIQAAVAASFPEELRGRTVVVRDFRSALFGGLGPGIRMLTVIVGLLLVIACANAANLLLGRAAGRTRDVAIRAALGASRRRLVVDQFAESLWLSLAAAGCGLLLAFWGTRLVWARSAPIFTRIGVEGIAFDSRLVLFALGLTALVAILFGMGPALGGSRVDLAEMLKAGAAASGRAGAPAD